MKGSNEDRHANDIKWINHRKPSLKLRKIKQNDKLQIQTKGDKIDLSKN